VFFISRKNHFSTGRPGVSSFFHQDRVHGSTRSVGFEIAMDDSDEFRNGAEEQYFAELCDISDVRFSMQPNKNRCRVVLVAESDTDFNLMKFYLALKAYVERIESEIGVMTENGEIQ
jgi:hypothetical protein